MRFCKVWNLRTVIASFEHIFEYDYYEFYRYNKIVLIKYYNKNANCRLAWTHNIPNIKVPKYRR